MREMTREEFFRAAEAFPRGERITLARDLTLSVEEEGADLSEAEWDAAWGAEADERLLEIEEGRAREIPGEEVTARVRAIVGS